MEKLTRLINLQLSLLHDPVEEQTLGVPCVERDAQALLPAGRRIALVGDTLVEAALEVRAGLLLDGLRVVPRDDGVAGRGAEGATVGVSWCALG